MIQETDKFIELLKPNYDDAVKYCRALCSNRSLDDAEDVLQQSLLQAYEKFDTLIEHDKFRSWFFTIITRVFYTSIRQSFWKRFLPIENHAHAKEIPEIFNRMENIDKKTTLLNALSNLSTKERSAILLFEIAGFTIDEIKDIQNDNSPSTVKSRLSRARQKLKKYILEAENKFLGNHYSSKNNIEDIENETIKLAAEYKQGK